MAKKNKLACKASGRSVSDLIRKKLPVIRGSEPIKGQDPKFLEDLLLPASLDNPDILGDNQDMWPERDYDLMTSKRKTVRRGLEKLNNRQKEILFLLSQHIQEWVANTLGISQQAIAKKLAVIRKDFKQGCNIP